MTLWQRGVVGPVGAGVVVLAGGLATAVGWLDWGQVGRWGAQQAGVLGVVGLAGVLIGIGFARAARRPAVLRTAPALSWWVVAAAAGVVAAVAWGATAALLREADRANDKSAARVEAIKTGLSIAAGTGGVFALLLAVRRQWHQERSTAATDLDAAEKRVTELYTKAADQLGSDKAPVRLAGLYALERVAQNNPNQRQTIVNVFCAYLRMPYQPPGESPAGDAPQELREEYRDRLQEREVRITAQRLLADHLLPGDPKDPATTFWTCIDLDLTGAVLVNFSLSNRSRSGQLQPVKYQRAQGDLSFRDVAKGLCMGGREREFDVFNFSGAPPAGPTARLRRNSPPVALLTASVPDTIPGSPSMVVPGQDVSIFSRSFSSTSWMVTRDVDRIVNRHYRPPGTGASERKACTS